MWDMPVGVVPRAMSPRVIVAIEAEMSACAESLIVGQSTPNLAGEALYDREFVHQETIMMALLT